MDRNFHWYTEDDVPTADLLSVEDKATANGRPWVRYLLILLLLTVVASGLYRFVDQQAQSATAAVADEVLTSHHLIRLADARGDIELGGALLSGRQPAWAEAQRELIGAHRLYDRAPFGLQADLTAILPGSGNGRLPTGEQQAEVVLAPNLASAELSFRQQYVIPDQQQMAATVTLRHTAVYRRGRQGWLLAPPEPQFWGEWLTSREEHLSLRYPERDQALGRRLASDLDGKLAQMCGRLPAINCPAHFHLHVHLAPDPAALSAAADLADVIKRDLPLALPAPTLVGLPEDEAGYQALLRGYASLVMAVAVTESVAYDCCPHWLFYRALLESQLEELGLNTRPLAASDNDWLLTASFDDNAITAGWTSTDATGWTSTDASQAVIEQQVASLVDFLLAVRAPGTAVTDMQRRLQPASSFWNWVQPFLDDGDTLADLVAGWRDFTYRRVATAPPAPPPVPLPDQDIQIICDTRQETTLYRFDLSAATLLKEFVRARRNNFISVLTLPQGKGYLMHERALVLGQTESRLVLWQDGRETVVFDETADFPDHGLGLYLTRRIDPGGRYVLLGAWSGAQGRRLLDVESCGQGECVLQDIGHWPGWPTWSPGGDHMLVEQRTDTRPARGKVLPDRGQRALYLGDGRGQRLNQIGTGWAPFWADEERFAYIRLAAGQTTELVSGTVHDNQVQPWLSSSDLLAALPVDRRPPALFVVEVAVHPAGMGSFVAVASSSPQLEGPYTLFRLEADRFDADHTNIFWLRTTPEPVHVSFSPDGRWLTLSYYRDASRRVELVDLEADQVRHMTRDTFGAGWSDDGQWLVEARPGALILKAPAHDYWRLFVTDRTRCRHLSWADN